MALLFFNFQIQQVMEMSNQVSNQVKSQESILSEIQRTIPKEAHAMETLQMLHSMLLWCQDEPKIGQKIFSFIDDQLKFNSLLKSQL